MGDNGLPPVRYEALRKGFKTLCDVMLDPRMPTLGSVHMPRIAAGLAGGDWALIEPLILDTFIRKGIPVTVYDFPGGRFFDSRDEDTQKSTRRA